MTIGQTYYVIANTANPDLIQLADSSADAQNGVALAISSSATSVRIMLESASTPQNPFVDTRRNIVVGFNEIAVPPVTGTAQTFAPAGGSGIAITANLKTTESVQTGPLTGAGAVVGGAPTAGIPAEFSSFLLNLPALASGLTSVQPAPTLPGGNATAPPYAFAGSFAIQTGTSDVQATVGGNAVIQSGQNVQVTATMTQTTSDSTAAAISVPQGAGQSDASLALTLQLFRPTVEATVDSGARIDAFGAVDVLATLDYPFLVPFQNPLPLLENPTGLPGYILAVVSGAQNFIFNDWTRTSVTAGPVHLVAVRQASSWASGGRSTSASGPTSSRR